jgi:hypothetical protein
MGHSNLWGRINRPSGRPGSSDMPVDFGTVPLTDSNTIADYSNNLTLPTAHSGMTSNLRYTGSAIFFGPRSDHGSAGAKASEPTLFRHHLRS